jgi:cytochrome c peroxidase
MAFSHAPTVEVLDSIPAYKEEFSKAFGAPGVDIEKVKTAIAAFEETLVTPNSRFDKWLNGDDAVLSAEELAGYKLFKNSGCVACHNGPAVVARASRKWARSRPTRPPARPKAGSRSPARTPTA